MDKSLHDAVLAANRFGLGARPGDLQEIAHDPKEWVLSQLENPASPLDALQGLDDSPTYLNRYAEFRKEFRAARQQAAQDKNADVPVFTKRFGRDFRAETQLRARQQCATDSPVHERLVMFWSNHFTVSAESQDVHMVAGSFEREAIRPHVCDDFASLLLGVEQHPAMLLYLNNEVSIGPDSAVGQRRAQRKADLPSGINENLAREIMELHTLSVDGDYTQQDVIELARGLTGWRTPMQAPNASGTRELSPFGSVYQHAAHEPGNRELLGQSFDQEGLAQGRSMLRFLASQEDTARFIATKLARHYVADEPPEQLVEHLVKAYQQNKGELMPVYRALFTHDLAWQSETRKFRRPDEYLIAMYRALDELPGDDDNHWGRELRLLGQTPFAPRAPAGWGDTARDWVGADALWKRLVIAQRHAAKLDPQRDPMELAQDSLGPQLKEATAVAISQTNPRQGTAILLASPEFQWR
ncbi:DUF1800 domain-containing protein [Halomonas binhaiensis]|uniref:DUF1800 domain-containing protein n=1 Tax=Halomonas binhaiensis TaxID=2562282 RepID=A0A5C1NBH9_9GAMM|nr:DUF1800 domain-containing protein [Halomonas binhaiensis]QEM80300.1 DUF1800 domain-containing protein [Halomonas binhaiensis]